MSREDETARLFYPPGHFYSPIVNPLDIAERAETVWPAHPEVLGIDFRPSEHQRILTDVFPRLIGDYDYVELQSETTSEHEFYSRNSEFEWLDSRALFVLLREFAPKRVIGVGSGYSSLLIADNRRFFDGSIEFDCVHAHPPRFLRQPPPGMKRLVQEPVERVNVDFFTGLGFGDVLFIDSSHVAKTGSDVNFLCFEVLPRLARGVRIHFHDILLPAEYPRAWVVDENRSWNEQYVLRALLMYSTGFRVAFGCNYAHARFPGLVANALKLPVDRAFGGGSLWIEKT
jgi:hypothetical protein